MLGGALWLLWPDNTGDSNARSSPKKDKPTKPKYAVSEPPPSDLAYPGFYPPRYEIDAEYTESPHTISGTEKLRYVNAEDEPMKELRFQVWTNEKTFTDLGGGTQIRNATVNGDEARLDLGDTELTLALPKPLPKGATADVEFEFKTTIPEIEAPFGHHRGVSSLGVWYPILAVYDNAGWHISPPTKFGEPYFAEASDYKVNLTLPKDLTPAATGVETNKADDGASRTFTYEAKGVRDFALAVGEDFSVESRRVEGTTVNIHYRPESAFRAERAADLAAASLKYFSEIYGPYPYEELDIVDAPLLSGTEYSTLTFVSIANSEDYIFDTVVPHEVAHQWWYLKVGNDQFASPWLDESLATYSEWLFTGDADTRFPDPVEPYASLDSPVDAFPDTSSYQNTTYLHG
ncbi:MAG: M1 family metallopeptidase, partial [Rubrobacteraceae bacterium]